MAKYFEKNIRKGDFSRPKVRGKRAIDLGSGMGLGGLAFALLGADVVLTDMGPVLPLLRRNYENNLSPAALKAASGDGHQAEAVGQVSVAELDWSQPHHFTGGGQGGAGVVKPPFDYILAADCIYHEHLIRHLYRALLALSNEKTTVLVANEKRSESVQKAFTDLFSHSFTFKKIAVSKMAEGYHHPSIELTMLKRRKDASLANLDELEAREAEDAAAAAGAAAAAEQRTDATVGSTAGAAAPSTSALGHEESAATEAEPSAEDACASTATCGERGPENDAGCPGDGTAMDSLGNGSSTGVVTTAADDTTPPSGTAMALAGQMAAGLGISGTLTFEERRAGSMAARLLSDVRVPQSPGSHSG